MKYKCNNNCVVRFLIRDLYSQGIITRANVVLHQARDNRRLGPTHF